jgi:hypothetical protein
MLPLSTQPRSSQHFNSLATRSTRWLDPSQPESLQQTLLPAGTDALPGAGLLQYEVVVYTSDLRGAGTDANVSVELLGAQERSGPLRLDTSADNFERGRRDVFSVRAPDVGPLAQLVVRKDAAGLSNDWHLAAVEVLHPGAWPCTAAPGCVALHCCLLLCHMPGMPTCMSASMIRPRLGMLCDRHVASGHGYVT